MVLLDESYSLSGYSFLVRRTSGIDTCSSPPPAESKLLSLLELGSTYLQGRAVSLSSRSARLLTHNNSYVDCSSFLSIEKGTDPRAGRCFREVHHFHDHSTKKGYFFEGDASERPGPVTRAM
jgi:hypothetical protein